MSILQLLPRHPFPMPQPPTRIVLDEITEQSIALDKVEQRRAKHDAVLAERTSAEAIALFLAACPEEVPTLQLFLSLMHKFALYRVVQDAERLLSERYGPGTIGDVRR